MPHDRPPKMGGGAMISSYPGVTRFGRGAVLAAGLMVAACGPQYETRTIYLPPETPEERQCIVEARADREACLTDARAEFEDCRREQRWAAESRFSRAQDAYLLDQQVYFQCRNSALNEVALLNDQREAECRRLAEGGIVCDRGDGFIIGQSEIDHFVNRRCREPDRPELEDFVNLSACGSVEGNCVFSYDAAYRGCGGEVRRIQECVAFCD